MRRSRIGMRRKQKKINIAIVLFFLVILPITAVAIGSRITEWLVVPTINTSDILKPPSPEDIGFENDDEVEDNAKEGVKGEISETQNKEMNTETINLNSISVHMIQVASISDNKNIEALIKELGNHQFPHIIYKLENAYKVYTFSSTKREDIEEKLDKVREVYPDAYIGQIHIPQRKVNYLSEENNGTKEFIESMNSILELLDQSSDKLYKLLKEEGKLEEYKEVLLNHENILKKLSEKINNTDLPKEFASVADVKKMLDYQEKNIVESLKIVEEKQDIYELQNYFLDNLFRTIEIIKK